MKDRRKNSLFCKILGHKTNKGFAQHAEGGWSEQYQVYCFCDRCNRYITFKLEYPGKSYKKIWGMREMEMLEKDKLDEWLKEKDDEFVESLSESKRWSISKISIPKELVPLTFMCIAVFVFFFVTALKVFGAEKLPDYKNYVNDFTGKTVSQTFLDKENAKLKAYDEKTSNQIAVAIIDSTEPLSIEEYSIDLAEKWKPGTEKEDNGVLMTFAMEDRKMRIEVGMGLEGEITDLEAKRIIEDHITPLFKEKRYEEGISQGIDQVILSIATDTAKLVQGTDNNLPPEAIVLLVILGVVLLVVIIIAIADSPYTPLGGSGSWGISTAWGDSSDSSSDSDGFGGFGGGGFSGGGASGGW